MQASAEGMGPARIVTWSGVGSVKSAASEEGDGDIMGKLLFTYEIMQYSYVDE